MLSLSFLAVAGFLLSLLLTPLMRNVFRSLGVVDRPDHRRKVHPQPIPRVGGVPIMAAYVCAFALLALMPFQGKVVLQQAWPLVWKLIPAVLVVFATGLLDDLIGLKPWEKFAGQCFAAGLACWAGIRIYGVARFQVNAAVGIALTVLWLVACTNAFNLIDGVDGLACGVGLFATLTTLVAALLMGHYGLALATAPLAGALLGFLRFNFNPASIFLGDSGSLTVGFLLGCYAVIWSQKSATLLGMTAPLMALSIPLLDTALAVVRRILRRQPLFSGDRAHIHHKLLDRGFTPRRVALFFYGLCGLAAAFSLLQSVVSNQVAGFIVVLFCLAAWVGIQHLGYAELGVAGRLMVPGTFLRVLNAELRLRTLEQSLTDANSVEACWEALRDACRDFGFVHVAMRVDSGGFEQLLRETDGAYWTVHVPLSESEYVTIGQEFRSGAQPLVVAPLADVLRRSLSPKLRAPDPDVAAGAG
ncbi:MAG: MraY family glycosyltransferase [Bryobacteraceae bacterium]